MATIMPHALVTGGAGYIGAHMVDLLLTQGWQVSIIDNLSTGHKDTLDLRATFYNVDLCDADPTRQTLQMIQPDIVFHFAALSIVSESFAQPDRYMHNNVHSTENLLAAMKVSNCLQFVYSSTCAIYGEAKHVPIQETHEKHPLSPYGQSKLVCEKKVQQACKDWSLNAVALRYFNVAGCASERRLRERHEPETHLIPNLLLAACKQSSFHLYGTEHPTPDGTAIRDYIHVLDLVENHFLAADKLLHGAVGCHAFNLGSGEGYSVRQVLSLAEQITGKSLCIETHAARKGDAPKLFADTQAWNEWIGTNTTHHSMQDMIQSTWDTLETIQ